MGSPHALVSHRTAATTRRTGGGGATTRNDDEARGRGATTEKRGGGVGRAGLRLCPLPAMLLEPISSSCPIYMPPRSADEVLRSEGGLQPLAPQPSVAHRLAGEGGEEAGCRGAAQTRAEDDGLAARLRAAECGVDSRAKATPRLGGSAPGPLAVSSALCGCD